MSSKYAVLQELISTPLGRGDGEANLQTPFNQGPTTVVVRVINHSRTAQRRILKKAVSFNDGGYETEVLEKYKGMSSEAIQKNALTRDMNVYTTGIKPVKARLPFDGRDYIVPPAKSESEEPVPTIVPEGLWDMYMGNWERMNGTPQERTEEINRLASRFSGRENPAMTFNRDGSVKSGYLEFVREEVRPSAYAADRDSLGADSIEEV